MKLTWTFLLLSLPILLKSQDKIILNERRTIYVTVKDITSYGIQYIDDNGQMHNLKEYKVKSIEYDAAERVLLKDGKFYSGKIFHIHNGIVHFGINGRPKTKNISTSRILEVKYSDGSKKQGHELKDNIYVGDEKFVTEKIKKQNKQFEAYSYHNAGSLRLFAGFNLLNEVHLGIGKSFSTTNSLEFQVGYYIPIRSYIMLISGLGRGYLYNYCSLRQIQQGVAIRSIYNFHKIKSNNAKTERSVSLEYQYLLSRDIYSITPTGYHNEEYGTIYTTTSHNVAFTYGRNYFLNNFIAAFLKAGISADFTKRYYSYSGYLNLDTGEKLGDGTIPGGPVSYTEKKVLLFPFIRIGINIYFRK